MTLKRFLTILATILSLTAVSAQNFNRTDINTEDLPTHDPVIMECDGTWYMFTTGFLVDIMTSKDLVTWDFSGHVFDKAPEWAVEMVPGYNGHTWAPDILFHNGTYYLYYSCSTFGKNTSAIGVATNKTLNPDSPDYKWEDHGCVVNSVGGRDLWNAIDPNVVIDEEGTGWLSFGSFWGGIKLVRLDETLTRPSKPEVWYPICRRPEGTAEDTSETDDAITADPRGTDFDPGNGAVEAPFIYKHGDYYYLFVSYDLCCRGAKSTYKVVCGRSKTVNGPYIDAEGTPLMLGGGTVVVSGNDRFPGIGHCAVVDVNGKATLFCHAYDKKADYGSRLVIREIIWDKNGWPSVKL